MKAAISNRYGGPEVVRLGDVPRPEPAPGEVRVRVHAATVSRSDCGMLRAHPFFIRLTSGLLRPKLRILGLDFAGTVDKAGAGVTAFRAGDRVFGMSPRRYGTHAEYLCIPAEGAIAPLPAGLPFDEAVVCEGAWYANSTIRKLDAGESLLVYGASGAIGTAAVQLARARGVHVTAVVATRHLELARALGAERVIDYTAEDFTALPDRFDIVFDAVGKESYFRCRRLLKPGGLFASTDLGPGWSNVFLALWNALTGRTRVEIPLPVDSPAFVTEMAGLLAAGKFHGVFDRSYPLTEIADAYRYVETGEKTGIVVLRLP
ncbi:NAD(P)-dependent alcohol dehydrogenase [Actibacterium sp. MT2.3-13A]|uniref:NAD(P)-dependent alcohol dehydrogenase n=1 Tax=Actibacterium sp. MT2.3-13A TaxID=2828332 RepID=UPI001BAB04C3|nr:NAD(P)-dependent alcohol dehydrogenase [Actibacterium sp. MT2.3-13A]